jgi:DNA-binding LacI/PurR family transcriptional regulator
MQRVTLHDIARRAGVSIATVSLALRGRGEVSRSRAQQIRTLAEEMGYRPNPMLAALASKRFSNAKSRVDTPLAILEFPPLPGGAPQRSNLYRKPLIDEAHSLGYAPSHHVINERTSATALHRQLYNRSTQGIVVTGSVDMEQFGAAFDWSAFSVVQCARYRAECPFHTIRSNIFQSVKLAFNRLQERGYQRIGFVLGRHEVLLEDDEDRHGAAVALETAHLARKDRVPPYLEAIENRPAFMAWFTKHRPEAVVGFTSLHYWYLKEAGVNIPDDVGFAVLHGASTDAIFSGLAQNNEEIARQSIHQLDLLIRNHERGLPEHPVHILIPSTWHNGQTLRPAAAQGVPEKATASTPASRA